MRKIKTRSIWTIILSAFCAVLLACSIGLFSGISSRAQTAADLADNSKTLRIGELTQDNYNSSTNPNAVFDRDNLNALYSALTGGAGNTLQAVKNSVTGATVSYGSSTTSASGAVQLPKYKGAYELYSMNSNKNIVVDFGGQTWTVTFLTTDTSGDVIATLWLADGYKDDAGTYQKSVFSWNNSTAGSSAASVSATSYAANMYSSSLMRVKTLNGGNADGSATKYAWTTPGSATVAGLNGTVSSAERVDNPWAIYTLNNTALSGSTKADKSLIDFIDTPSQLKYTYYEDFVYHYTVLNDATSDSYYLNEAITKDLTGDITGTVGANTVKNTYGNSQYMNGWYSQTMYNIAYTNYTEIGYNDWAYDRVWIPSWSETGSMKASDGVGCLGIWRLTDPTNVTTRKTIQTGQLSAGNVYWTRSGTNRYTNFFVQLSGSAQYNYASSAAERLVRPALHLNLTKAEGNTSLRASDISTTTAYDNATEKPVTYNGSQHTLAYLKPDWYISKYYTDSDRIELTYEFIKQGDTTTTFDTPALGKDGTTPHLIVNPTVATDLVDAGKYKITIKLKDDNLFWDDDELDYDSASPQEKELARYKVVKFEIKQAEIKYKWKNIGLTDWKVAYNQNFTATGSTAAPWVYLDYTLIDTENSTTPSATTKKLPYVVLKFTGSDAQFGDNVIDNIDNVRGGTSKGSNYPKHADTYTVSFVDKNKDTSNYKLVADTGENDTRSYTITRMQVTAPGEMSALTYNGAPQSFGTNLANYNKLYMTYGTLDGMTYQEGVLPQDDEGNDLFDVTETGNNISLSATDAGKYKLYYRLKTETNESGNEVVRDYKWSDASDADPAPVKFMEYEIKPVTLEFAFTSSATGGSWTIKSNDETSKLTYAYATGKGPVTGETPVIEIWYYFNSDGADKAVKYDASATELPFKDLKNFSGAHAVGKYTVVLKLADSDDNPVNKNYAMKADESNPSAALATYTKEFTLSAAEASLDDIKIVYKSSLMGESDDPVELPESPDNLKYAYDDTKNSAVEYLFTLDFSAVDYLQVVGSYAYTYSDGTSTNSFAKADKVTVTVKIEVKADKRSSNKLPAQSAYTGTKFKTYTPDAADSDGNIYSATLTFEYEIGRAEIDLSEIEFEYGWQEGGKVEYKGVYDPENPPEFLNKNVYLQVKKPYPLWIKADSVPELTYGMGNRNAPGKFDINVKYTLDPNYQYTNDEGTVYKDTYTHKYEISLAKKQINVSWTPVDFDGKDDSGKPIVDGNGLPYQIYAFNGDEALKQYIKYEYYYPDEADASKPGNKVPFDGETALKYLIENDGAGKVNPASGKVDPFYVYIKMVINEDASGSDKYELSYGEEEYQLSVLGAPKAHVSLNVLKGSSVYGDEVNYKSIYELTADGEKFEEGVDAYIYPEGKPEGKKPLADFDFKTANAGKYTIKLELNDDYSENYALTTKDFIFTVKPVELVVPTLKDGASFTYNGEDQQLSSKLQNFNETYMEFAKNSIHEAKNAGAYPVIINIKAEYAGNYIFVLPEVEDEGETPVKAVVKYALAADAAAPELTADKTTATFKWTINKFAIDTASENSWNFGKNGATLNLPDWVKAFTLGAEPSLKISTLYYDTEGTPLSEYVFKAGNKFLVAAYIDPDCADAGNFEFKGQKPDVAGVIASPQTTYTVPKSGAAALLGDAKEFVSNKWLGLPIWAWLAIALTVLILLIIIIAVCVKRSKTKEQRAEQRRMQQEKLQAERELAMARQQAELERIRSSVGMASTATQQAPAQQQQAMPAPVQTQMQPVQQPAQMQAMQQPMQQQMPAQGGGVGMTEMMAMMFAQFAGMKADNADKEIAALKSEKEITALKTELEIMKLKLEQIKDSRAAGENMRELTPEFLGAVIASAIRGNGVLPQPAVPELSAPEPETTTASAVYPPDAVITTTTTVDTTARKADKTEKPVRAESRDRSGKVDFDDVDGFYDEA